MDIDSYRCEWSQGENGGSEDLVKIHMWRKEKMKRNGNAKEVGK